MNSILFIHQSAELYGSDKTLLYLVQEVQKNSDFVPIVVLPENGPLVDKLENDNIEVIISPVFKVSRAIFKPKNAFRFLQYFFRGPKVLHQKLNGRKIDIVHSNTLAVLLGAVYSRKYKVKHIWHVHEIINSPKFIHKFYEFLLRKFADKSIFNSNATMGSWAKTPVLKKKSKVIFNGMDRTEPKSSNQKIQEIRETYYNANPDSKVIGLVGRFNHWKGQVLLLEAFDKIKDEFPNVQLVFIGSVFKGNEHFKEVLEKEISNKKLEDRVQLIPFQEDIWPFWDAMDVAVVPSTEPEPFGLVAVEAMLSEKPVIAARYGGLTDIVVDGETGLFFKPNNVEDLSEKLRTLLLDADYCKSLGKQGKKVAHEKFSLEKYSQNFITEYKNAVE